MAVGEAGEACTVVTRYLDIYLFRYLFTDAEEGDEEEHCGDDDGVAPAQGPQQQPGQQTAHLGQCPCR